MSAIQKIGLATTSVDNALEVEGAITATTGAVLDASAITGDGLFAKLGADGNGGVTLGATMTISPETTAESGFLTISVAGVNYQLPIYAE